MYYIGVLTCTDVFYNMHYGRRMTGGMNVGSVDTSFACVALCDSNPVCAGLVWDSSTLVCELFEDTVPPLSTAITMSTSYYYVKCYASSSGNIH